MRILLVGNYPHQAQQSMQRFVHLLKKGLEVAGHEVRLVQPEPFFGRLRPSATGIGKWLGYIDRLVLFPFALQRALGWADVVHICDHGNAVYVPLLKRKPHLVTCHDMLGARSARREIPQNPVGWAGRWLSALMMWGLAGAQHVVCVSHTTQRELFRLCPKLPEGRTGVIENGLNYPYRPMALEEARARLDALGVPRRPFLVHVGGNQWYKNRLGVLRIFEALSCEETHEVCLVMAGKPWVDDMRRFVRERGLSDRVLELVAVDEEDLRALYSAAEGLLFPSLEEGFGWPIIEAQACGCPVFASNRPPMTEVGGNVAIYFDPTRVLEAAWAIRGGLANRSKRAHSTPASSTRFSAEKMIDQYIRQYGLLIERPFAPQTSS